MIVHKGEGVGCWNVFRGYTVDFAIYGQLSQLHIVLLDKVIVQEHSQGEGGQRASLPLSIFALTISSLQSDAGITAYSKTDVESCSRPREGRG